MNIILLLSLALLLSCTVMTLVWWRQLYTNNAGIVDGWWAFLFGIIAMLYTVLTPASTLRELIMLTMAVVWSFRLGSHLLIRNTAHVEEDIRYKKLRHEYGDRQRFKMWRFFMYQAFSNVLLSAPFLFVSIDNNNDYSFLLWLGVGVWIIAIIGESIADDQLKQFKQDPTNKGKVCRTGLWNYSRHPNYFFEWLIWVSYAIVALDSSQGWLALYCPLLMYWLLNNVTGIPMLEQLAIKSKGVAYTEYQQTTNAFFPWFSKKQIMYRVLLITLLFAPKIVLAQYEKAKNISYLPSDIPGFDPIRHTLDVYYPTDTTKGHNVFVFIHGGSWKHGKKDTYRFLAKNMIRRGFVAVMINYRLSPSVKYEEMVDDCEAAVAWIANNISSFGGDPDKITIASHSAGGHLAAMVAMNKSQQQTPISKVVLIDAFGLDMFTYFNSYHNDYAQSLYSVFSNDSSNWKKASPLYLITPQVKTEFLVLAGSKTYPAILHSSHEFANRVRAVGGMADYHIIARKRHIGMIIQLYFQGNKVYKLMTDFINKSASPVK